MKKMLMLIVVVIVLIAGCSSTEGTGREVEPATFELNETELEEQGYTDLADIAFAKAEQVDGNIMVYLKYKDKNPEKSIYLMGTIMKEMNYDCDFEIVWGEEEYLFTDENFEGVTKDNVFEFFPESWENTLVELYQSGSGMDYIVSKGVADDIEEDVIEFVNQYTVSIEENTRPQGDILAEKTYSIGEDKFSFSFSESNGEYSFHLLCNIQDKVNAFYTQILLNEFVTSEEESLQPLSEIFSYSIFVGDGTSIHHSPDAGTFIMSSDEDALFVSADEYFSAEWLVEEADKLEESSSYGEQVVNFMADFLESNG